MPLKNINERLDNLPSSKKLKSTVSQLNQLLFSMVGASVIICAKYIEIHKSENNNKLLQLLKSAFKRFEIPDVF